MKQLTEVQLQDNWNKLIQVIKDTFEDGSERREKLLKMYHDLEDRMIMAPASGKEEYHYCHVGGYVEHVLHVVDTARKMSDTYEASGGHKNWTDEELVFSALHHDLGKVGDMDKDYYVPQDSEWHRKNRGEIFTHNGELSYMTVTDRAIFLLNQFGIKMSENEYIGLRLTDGLYEEANKTYYMNWSKDNQLKSNIAYILHQADMMATKIEYNEWQRDDYSYNTEFGDGKTKEEMEKIDKQNMERMSKKKEESKRSHELFKELFDE